jgi:multicomponent Na+:H+ antiporter subunit B
VILLLLVVTVFVIIRARSLWAGVMLTGAFSFLGASWMLFLDAPDVAFTEAAVGAGIATVLMLGTLSLVGGNAEISHSGGIFPLLVVIATGGALAWGTLDMPVFGDPNAPIHLHPDPSYVERSNEDVGVPNVVTSVLASYRGFDTLGETVVVFTAAVAVMMLLRQRRDGQDLEPSGSAEKDSRS